ncbi:MAG: single-stranded-DNA-specific exonuclease RecJ [Gammaproteobacteria bacterium]|nr:single-stranded-DNA-specific exonuclease RecJ [Gammaproteobacteria bacterium]
MILKNKIVRRIANSNTHELRQSEHIHPTLARIYRARSVDTPEQLHYSLDRLLPPEQLAGIDQAVDLLADALYADARVLIVGDFDADGATSCALGVLALRAMGCVDVGYLVPNRFEYGYGLTPEIVDVAKALQPDLLITVDNGISSCSGVRAANELGMTVLITDHHLPGAELPAAAAVVNPNVPGDRFPSKNLAGVGVVFYVLLALRARLRTLQWFQTRGIKEPNLAAFLDLVALGTVADLVPLDHNNRILVFQGLKRINAGRCRPGIDALLHVAGREPGRAVASDLGYAVAPRLNAAGRLEDMSVGIECLLTSDAASARAMAMQLDQLNRERRSIEAQMQQQAAEAVGRIKLDRTRSPKALCLFDDQWHQGVVGLVAGRVCERIYRPVIAFAPGGDGELKGSARSIAGLHIRDVLDAVATQYPKLLQRFGGHAMAAGLTLRRGDLDEFTAAFERQVSERLGDSDLEGVIASDGSLEDAELGLEFAELVRSAGPWGQGFPEPLFDGVFTILDTKVVGDVHLKLHLRQGESNKECEAIAFQYFQNHDDMPSSKIHIAYKLDVNEYRGVRLPQLIIEHLEMLQS